MRNIMDISNIVLRFRNVHVCPSSLRVWHHWVGASRPDDSVAEEDEEDAARLFRVPRRAFFATRKGPTGLPTNKQWRSRAIWSRSIHPKTVVRFYRLATNCRGSSSSYLISMIANSDNRFVKMEREGGKEW